MALPLPFELTGRSFINGAWHKASGGDTFAVRNPATDELLAEVDNCGYEDALAAIEAAKIAFPSWRNTPASDRAELLKQLAAAMLDSKSVLSRLLTAEQGKPLVESEREVVLGAANIEWFAEEAKRIYGETIPASKPEHRITVLREPVGVCAAITPWNFPNLLVSRKLAPALAAGCTIIIKPAPETPLSALAIAALSAKVGIPPGVLNIIAGDAEPIAEALLTSPTVKKLSFTGSTEVGKLLMRRCADTVKKITLELGGNAPFIVFEDADLELVIREAIFAKYRNAGQTCIGINRFLVHEGIAKIFVDELTAATKKLKVGNGVEPGVDLGPLINTEAVAKVSELVADALNKGAKCSLGGKPDGKNLFVSPCILEDITPAMKIWNEEIFGPVCSVATFKTEEEAIALANNTSYGLAGYLFTRDISRMYRVTEALEFGMVGVNNTFISVPQAPFGGIKQSGFGREGGRAGIEDYLNLKYVAIGV